MNDQDLGLYPKYRIWKIAKQRTEEDRVEELVEVLEPAFVLKFNDPYARAALRSYASMCKYEYPNLARDINEKLDEVVYGDGYAVATSDGEVISEWIG